MMTGHLVINFVGKDNLVSGETYTFLHRVFGIMQGVYHCEHTDIKHYYKHFALNYYVQGCLGDRVSLDEVLWVGTIDDSIK